MRSGKLEPAENPPLFSREAYSSHGLRCLNFSSTSSTWYRLAVNCPLLGTRAYFRPSLEYHCQQIDITRCTGVCYYYVALTVSSNSCARRKRTPKRHSDDVPRIVAKHPRNITTLETSETPHQFFSDECWPLK